MGPALAHAHEPVFGLGAHTLYKGGYGLEIEFTGEKAGDEREDAVDYKLSYGVTPDFTIGLAMPQVIEKKEGGQEASGLGDMTLHAKYRFIRVDAPGSTTGVAVNLAVKLPTGDETKRPKLGTGSADFITGLAVSREGLRHYFFSDVRYRANSEANGTRKGNLFFFDIAYGIRPWKVRYLKPDLVILAELNYEKAGMARTNGTKDADTGGRTFFISPGFLLSYRNVMFKGGVQVPLSQDLNGTQEELDYRALLSVEFHL
ncbi:MAG: transporter [Thermodesulfobacteriota bacterium]